jgi:hypothetical protein
MSFDALLSPHSNPNCLCAWVVVPSSSSYYFIEIINKTGACFGAWAWVVIPLSLCCTQWPAKLFLRCSTLHTFKVSLSPAGSSTNSALVPVNKHTHAVTKIQPPTPVTFTISVCISYKIAQSQTIWLCIVLRLAK